MEINPLSTTKKNETIHFSRIIPWLEFVILLVTAITCINLYTTFVAEEQLKLSLGSVFIQAVLLGLCVIHGCVIALGNQKSRKAKIIRMLCVGATILFTLVTITLIRISVRATVNPAAIHDSAIQTEAAFDDVMSKKNPYSATFEQSFPTGTWNPIILNGHQLRNPAIEHYIYLPGQFLIEGVVGSIEKATLGIRDARILNLLLVIALAATIGWILRRSEWMPALLLLFSANPVVIRFLSEGRNDFLFLGLVCFAFLALAKKQLAVSAVLFGLALTTKQFAWFCVPFLFVYFWKVYGLGSRELIRFGVISFGIFAIVCIPFVAWDAPAFFDDVIRFPAGSATGEQIPITGFGFSPLITAFGVSETAYFPFWIFMIAATAPLIVLFGRRIHKNPNIPLVIAASFLTLFAALLFSRFLQQNYVMVILQAMCWALVLLLVEYEKNPISNV